MSHTDLIAELRRRSGKSWDGSGPLLEEAAEALERGAADSRRIDAMDRIGNTAPFIRWFTASGLRLPARDAIDAALADWSPAANLVSSPGPEDGT